jgi:acyl carrier protein
MPLEEQEVAQIWADVIGIREADVETNFFDLGGHSLLLTELIGRLNEKLGIDVDIVMLLEHPTVATFTAHWNEAEPGPEVGV